MAETIARTLRKNMTDAERVFWRAIRDRQLSGAKFRRQFPIGRYVADFVCFEHRLVVEIDGGQHAGSASDQKRTAWLASQGFRVIRFWNNEVLSNLEGVQIAISEAIASGPLTPTPLPRGERG
jgi:adenine-specific DNA-methyltransferase